MQHRPSSACSEPSIGRGLSWAVALGALAFGATTLGAERVAEAKDVAESYQTWGSFTFQKNWKNLAFYTDITNRFYDDFHPSNQQIRPALGYKLGDGRYLYLGYVYSPAWGDKVVKAADSDDGLEHRTHAYINEHRVWQQLTNEAKLPFVNVFLRTRLEERFRPDVSSNVGLRARQLLRFLVPTVRGFPLRLSIWDEVLLNLNTATQPNAEGGTSNWQSTGFDQNRFFVGPSLDFAKVWRVEAGYFNQFVRQPDRATDAMRHVFLMQWFVTLN